MTDRQTACVGETMQSPLTRDACLLTDAVTDAAAAAAAAAI